MHAKLAEQCLACRNARRKLAVVFYQLQDTSSARFYISLFALSICKCLLYVIDTGPLLLALKMFLQINCSSTDLLYNFSFFFLSFKKISFFVWSQICLSFFFFLSFFLGFMT